jgi:stress response protein SCP2
VDAAGQLSDDRYMVFYNQPSTPCRSIQLSQGVAAGQTSFACTLATLPPTIDRLVFTVSIDGTAGVSAFLPSFIRVGADTHYPFGGADFTAETSLRT